MLFVPLFIINTKSFLEYLYLQKIKTLSYKDLYHSLDVKNGIRPIEILLSFYQEGRKSLSSPPWDRRPSETSETGRPGCKRKTSSWWGQVEVC